MPLKKEAEQILKDDVDMSEDMIKSFSDELDYDTWVDKRNIERKYCVVCRSYLKEEEATDWDITDPDRFRNYYICEECNSKLILVNNKERQEGATKQ